MNNGLMGSVMRDKEFCQRYYILILFAEISQIGIKNGKTSERVTKLRDSCTDLFLAAIKRNKKDMSKMFRRCQRGIELIYNCFIDKQTNLVNTHKLILALHEIALIMKRDKLLGKKAEKLIEEFLKIEGEQSTTFDGKSISDQDWLRLKASADKKVEEIFNIVKNI